MVHISFYSHQISTTLCLRNCLFLSCQRWNDNISPQVNESVGRFAMYWHFPWKVNIHRCGVPTKLARTRMLSDTPEWEHPKPYNSNPSSSNFQVGKVCPSNVVPIRSFCSTPCEPFLTCWLHKSTDVWLRRHWGFLKFKSLEYFGHVHFGGKLLCK